MGCPLTPANRHVGVRSQAVYRLPISEGPDARIGRIPKLLRGMDSAQPLHDQIPGQRLTPICSSKPYDVPKGIACH
jgi:hypothetical protein